MHDFDQFERRLAAAVRSDADRHIGPFEARSIARAAIAGSERRARRLGRGRGMMLLAAASLLLVGGALAAGSGFLRLPSVALLLPAPSVVEVATASPDATSPGPSESAAPSASPIPVAGPGGVWIPTGSMVTPRYGHSAVRLQDGRVLVVGGASGASDPLASAQLYDPVTGTWSATGDMPGPIGSSPVAVLLRDGTVLVQDSVYDPASGTWTSTDPMAPWSAWPLATVTALRDGKALVTKADDARLYDPASGTWAATGKMNVFRERAAATLLSDGKVLVAGGEVDFAEATDSAEVYDPVTGSWTAIANMLAPGGRRATLLRDGKVLVVGSERGDDGVLHGVAQVYDPATGSWSGLSVRPDFVFDSAALLSDGTVLVTGRRIVEQPVCAAADLYDPRTGSWTTASSMLRCDELASFTPLLDGTVLKSSGSGSELYVPAGVSLPSLPTFPSAPPPVISSPAPTPSPTPRPTPFPPATGPVPPNARRWTVTVENRSSEPAALFVAGLDDNGMSELVGSATPNVVPAGVTVDVTFVFPAKGADAGWIYVNPRPGEGGALVNADDIGIPGKILIGDEGDAGWLSP